MKKKSKEENEKKKKQRQCKHKNSYVQKEGMTGQLGIVICPDCGYEREWNAY